MENAIGFHGLSNNLYDALLRTALILVLGSSPERMANSMASLRSFSIHRPPTKKGARWAYINDSPFKEHSNPQNDDGEVNVRAWM